MTNFTRKDRVRTHFTRAQKDFYPSVTTKGELSIKAECGGALKSARSHADKLVTSHQRPAEEAEFSPQPCAPQRKCSPRSVVYLHAFINVCAASRTANYHSAGGQEKKKKREKKDAAGNDIRDE